TYALVNHRRRAPNYCARNPPPPNRGGPVEGRGQGCGARTGETGGARSRQGVRAARRQVRAVRVAGGDDLVDWAVMPPEQGRAGRPYVLLSSAVSVDGCLDAPGPRRLVLSGEADLDRIDEERARADAIMVGAATIRRDDPRLLIRSPGRRAARAAAGLP